MAIGRNLSGVALLIAALFAPLPSPASEPGPGYSVAQAQTCDFETAPKAEVEAAARRWLDDLGSEGLVFESKSLAAIVERSQHAPLPAYIRTVDDNWHITLGFETEIASTMSAEDVGRSLSFVANNGIPIPELATPGWMIVAQSPSSHAESGLHVLEVAPGRLKVRVDYPRFFAVYGIDRRQEYLADAPTPDSCYFQISQDFPGTITFDLVVEDW